MEYEFHPACLILPRMANEEFQALKTSIENGYDNRHPILLHEGKILDGRHRYEACKELGIDPKFIQWVGGNPFEFVRREHEARRSWRNDVQKVLVCKRLNDMANKHEDIKRRVQEEANRKRAEAAREQHVVSRPWAGEKKEMVVPPIEAQPLKIDDWQEPSYHRKPEPARDFSEVNHRRTTAAIASTIGVSRQAVERAQYLEKHNPELAEKVAQGEMAADAAVKEIKKEKRRQEIEEQRQEIEQGKATLPKGVFEVMVIDPPWNYGREYDPDGSRVANPYPEMTQDQLLKLNPPFADNSVLFLWTTHAFLFDAKELLDHWGFGYKATLVWDKEKIGMGAWLRMQCEFCLVGIKGKPTWENTSWRDIIREARREHSRKPDAFYKMVNEITVGRKLDFFSREQRNGWEVFGNDVGKFSTGA